MFLTAFWLQIKLYEMEYTSYPLSTSVIFDKASRHWTKSGLYCISCSSAVEMERWGEKRKWLIHSHPSQRHGPAVQSAALSPSVFTFQAEDYYKWDPHTHLPMLSKEIVNVCWIKREKAINNMCSVQMHVRTFPSCHVSVLQRQWVNVAPSTDNCCYWWASLIEFHTTVRSGHAVWLANNHFWNNSLSSVTVSFCWPGIPMDKGQKHSLTL